MFNIHLSANIDSQTSTQCVFQQRGIETSPSLQLRQGKKKRLSLVVAMETVSLSLQGEGTRLLDELG